MAKSTRFQIERIFGDCNSTCLWDSHEMMDSPIRLSEGFRYRFSASSNDDLTLFIGDEYAEPVLVQTTPDSTKQTWIYSPDFYAGEVEIQLMSKGRRVLSCRADVSPDPTKLGQAYYREILEDLETRASSCLYGGKAGGHRIKRSGENYPPMAFMAMLGGRIESFERAFAAIVSSPHRNLVSTRQDIKLHQVKRIDAVTVRSTARRPSLVASIRGIEGSSHRETINVPKRQHSFDTAPNRITLGFLEAIVRRCQELQGSLLSQTDSDESETLVSTKKERWSMRLAELEGRISRLSKSSFLDDLKPRSESSGAYIAIARHPAYNRFCRIAREILNPITQLAVESDHLLTLKSTFQLYEYWTYFAVLDEFRKRCPTLVWTNDLGLTKNELFHTLKSDSAATGTDGALTIRIAFQQSFHQGQPYTISRACRPDIVVQISSPLWERPCWILLDAKYRSMLGSIQSGIDDMHVYRDSIRYSPTEPAVSAAFILTPRALNLPIYDPAFHAEHGIGAIQVSPENVTGLSSVVDRAMQNLNS